MNIIKSCNFIIDSKGNKYCFFYNEGTIHCKMCDINNFIKETILINKVYKNFLCSISRDDIIYVLCQARNKDILLFINEGYGWHMNEIPIIKNSDTLIPMYLFHLKDSIHIIYFNKLSIANYYDIYHVIGKKEKWQRNRICELYSKKIHSNISLMPINNSCINMACTFFDGKQISLNHYVFNVASEKWCKNEILNLENLEVKVKLLYYNEMTYLICYTIENQVLTLFTFRKSLNLPFALMDINKFYPFNGKNLVIQDINEEVLIISYIENSNYYIYHYNTKSKKWLKQFETPLLDKLPMYHVKLIINDNSSGVSYKDLVCNISDDLDLIINKPNQSLREELNIDKLPINTDNNSTSFLIEQIKILTEKISHLNEKFNNIEINNNYYIKPKPKNMEDFSNYSDEITTNILKPSNFKEKFMKSKPLSLGLHNNSILFSNNADTFTEFVDSDYDMHNNTKMPKDKMPIKKEELSHIQNDNIGEQMKRNKLLKIIDKLLK